MLASSVSGVVAALELHVGLTNEGSYELVICMLGPMATGVPATGREWGYETRGKCASVSGSPASHPMSSYGILTPPCQTDPASTYLRT